MRHNYTSEEIEFLKNNVKGISEQELTNRFNKKFNCNVTVQAIAVQKSKYKLKNGLTGQRFKKGHIPYNKGKKGLKKANSGSFTKGHIPKNAKSVGSERINRDNCIEIKVEFPNKWRPKHHIIYEKYHNVKIGHWDRVLFLDGNKRNFNINNLELVSIKEQLTMAKNNFKSDNPEISKSYIALVKLMCKMSEIINNSKN